MSKSEPKGPDLMTDQQLTEAGGEQYPYLDQTRDVHVPLGAQGDGVPSSILNPAYYPKNVKPEVLHTEAEKAGADTPEGPIPGEVEDQSAKGEDFKDSPQSQPVGMFARLREMTGGGSSEPAGSSASSGSSSSPEGKK